jgi:hypothetical protein
MGNVIKLRIPNKQVKIKLDSDELILDKVSKPEGLVLL